MRKLLLPFIAAVALCLVAPLAAGAQSDAASMAQTEAARRAEASRARSDSMKLVREQQEADWAAKRARSFRIIWIVCIVGVSIGLYSRRRFIIGVIRALKGEFNTKGDVTTLESKKILIGAIYCNQQRGCLNTLATGVEIGRRNTILGEWWSITDPFSATDALDSLRDKGFGYYFPTVLKAFSAASDDERKEIILSGMTTQEDAEKAYTQTHNLIDTVAMLKKEKVIETENDIAKYGVLGWDVGRLAFMARLCHDAEYIDERQAWQYIDAAYAQAQSSFGSWNELAKSYIIGRCLWGGGSVIDDGMVRLVEILLESPKSPWNIVAWK